MKQKTSVLTQHYWINVWRGWMQARIEHNEIAAPQGEEAIAVADDLNALLNLPAVPDVIALAERLPLDFPGMMESLEEILGPIYTPDGKQLISDEQWREVTALISLCVERWIAAATAHGMLEAEDGVSHVFQHQSRDEAPTINVEVERNSRGFNWTGHVIGARSIEEALTVSKNVMDSLANVYGTQNAAIAEAARQVAEAKKKNKRGSTAADADELDDLT